GRVAVEGLRTVETTGVDPLGQPVDGVAGVLVRARFESARPTASFTKCSSAPCVGPKRPTIPRSSRHVEVPQSVHASNDAANAILRPFPARMMSNVHTGGMRPLHLLHLRDL